MEDLLGQFEGKIDGYEAILGKQKCLAGDVRASSCSKRAPLDHRCRWIWRLVCRILPSQIYSISHISRKQQGDAERLAVYASTSEDLQQ
jgi:hypothetical protein